MSGGGGGGLEALKAFGQSDHICSYRLYLGLEHWVSVISFI